MLKRIAISFMLLILISSIALSAYKIFEPKNKNTNNVTITGFYITLNNLKEYTLSTGDNTYHYYFFCSPEDKNCIYLYDSVFTGVKNQNGGISITNIIEYVDVTSYINNANYLSELQNWGINKYPALVSVKVENGEIIINNSLIYDEKNPLNITDIIEWLKLNNIYSGS